MGVLTHNSNKNKSKHGLFFLLPSAIDFLFSVAQLTRWPNSFIMVAEMRSNFFAIFIACATALTPEELQAGISGAISAGASTYIIPPDIYNFSASGVGGLNVSGATNLTIEGGGSTLIFFPGNGVIMTSSLNLTVRNLTVDYFPPCFTQGIISAIDVANSTLDVSIDSAFLSCSPSSPFPAPYFDAGEIKVIYFDPTTREHIRGQPGANLATFLGSPQSGICRMRIPGFSGFNPQVGWRASVSPRIYSTQYKIPDFYRPSTWAVLGSQGVLTQVCKTPTVLSLVLFIRVFATTVDASSRT